MTVDVILAVDVIVEVLTNSTRWEQLTAAGYLDGDPAKQSLLFDAAVALASIAASAATFSASANRA